MTWFATPSLVCPRSWLAMVASQQPPTWSSGPGSPHSRPGSGGPAELLGAADCAAGPDEARRP
jgi:hypothetical protein